ncbi:MAG: thiamine pyrophosphate-dependent enzyme, partial [Deltaproteobacteria bacterium]|nr:thiamine pyrophosphate-dependent enzyme [Deltaproteobacteria bacterium]
RRVFVFDGDGALWMNFGTLATIGLHQPKNLIHICWDNREYESSGGEPTVSRAGHINFAEAARAAGIHSSRAVESTEDLTQAVRHALNNDGPHFIWARIEPGRAEVPPLPLDELENKYRFIRYVEKTEGTSILRMPLPASYNQKPKKP